MTQLCILPLSRLSSSAHRQAVALYWQAFEGKLGRLLGPQQRATMFITQVMQPDHAYCALGPTGEVIGVAGFRSQRGSFVPLLPAHIRSIYGKWGAWWRLGALYLISEAPDESRFLIEGLAVHPDWRSQGIGTQLIEALTQEATDRGYLTMRLDVAEENTRARALYERLGFFVTARQRNLLLAPLFRMSGSRVMERKIG